MVIQFRLAWLQKKSLNQAFKLKPAQALYEEYLRRISKFVPCETLPFESKFEKKTGQKTWICDNGPGSKELSSVQLAKFLEEAQLSARTLDIMVGGPDGFSKDDSDRIKPDLKWSFGPMTLPHELAAVVAAEQIYRAWTIIKKFPYHLGH